MKPSRGAGLGRCSLSLLPPRPWVTRREGGTGWVAAPLGGGREEGRGRASDGQGCAEPPGSSEDALGWSHTCPSGARVNHAAGGHGSWKAGPFRGVKIVLVLINQKGPTQFSDHGIQNSVCSPLHHGTPLKDTCSLLPEMNKGFFRLHPSGW